jgi:hypothetical protein
MYSRRDEGIEIRGTENAEQDLATAEGTRTLHIYTGCLPPAALLGLLRQSIHSNELMDLLGCTAPASAHSIQLHSHTHQSRPALYRGHSAGANVLR